MLSRFPKSDPIWEISNPRIVQRKAKELLGKDTIIYRSNMKNKKYSFKKMEKKCITVHNYSTIFDFILVI